MYYKDTIDFIQLCNSVILSLLLRVVKPCLTPGYRMDGVPPECPVFCLVLQASGWFVPIQFVALPLLPSSLSVFLLFFLSVFLAFFFFLSFFAWLCLSLCLSVFLSFFLSFCRCLSVCLSFFKNCFHCRIMMKTSKLWNIAYRLKIWSNMLNMTMTWTNRVKKGC